MSTHLSARHGFQMLETEGLFLCQLPIYFAPPHSFQAILEASLPNKDMEAYVKTRKQNPGSPLIIMNQKPVPLKDIAMSSSFMADAFFAIQSGDSDGDPLIKSTTVSG